MFKFSYGVDLNQTLYLSTGVSGARLHGPRRDHVEPFDHDGFWKEGSQVFCIGLWILVQPSVVADVHQYFSPQQVFDVPQGGIVFSTYGQEYDVGFAHSILVMGHVYHVREGFSCPLEMAASHHHVKAITKQSNGQTFGKIACADDGDSWLAGSLLGAVLQPVGQETEFGAGRAAAQQGNRVHVQPKSPGSKD